jgi:hypothetical protein
LLNWFCSKHLLSPVKTARFARKTVSVGSSDHNAFNPWMPKMDIRPPKQHTCAPALPNLPSAAALLQQLQDARCARVQGWSIS